MMVVLCTAQAWAGARRTPVRAAAARRSYRRTPPCYMPEGPECRVHAEQLHDRFAGHTLRRVAIMSGRYAGNGTVPGRGAPPENWEALRRSLPADVAAVSSKGKFIWWSLRPQADALPELTFWSTLGMAGAWSLQRSVHSRVAFELFPSGEASDSQRAILFYNDQRNFGTLTVCREPHELEAKLASLGPSWLDGGVPLGRFLEIARGQCSTARRANVPLAKFLMDQGKTAGIGNYILSEVLYKAAVWPWATCGALADGDWEALHAAIAETIEGSYAAQAALAAAGGDGSLSATRGTFEEIEPEFRLLVYRQARTADGCVVHRGEGPHGRSVFWVPQRQVRGRVEEGEAVPLS
eukprot:3304163-Prymnesium_polylepis.1